jgi:hypothetical protein
MWRLLDKFDKCTGALPRRLIQAPVGLDGPLGMGSGNGRACVRVSPAGHGSDGQHEG